MANKRTKAEMGYVFYYEQWKQFTLEFNHHFIFNNQCLRDIADFLDQLNEGKE